MENQCEAITKSGKRCKNPQQEGSFFCRVHAEQELRDFEPDRKEAIGKAVAMAREGDIVLIAGKGHEDYQEIKGTRYPFSDKDVLEEFIKNKLNVQNAV